MIGKFLKNAIFHIGENTPFHETKKIVFFLAIIFILWFNVYMMNDMMPTIEETATLDILAQIEHEEWERGNEERERWEAVEATHGPLLTKVDLENYHKDMAERDAAFENAFKCDDDEDDYDSANDGYGTLADDAWHDANEYPEW